jgi:hypothetical protein
VSHLHERKEKDCLNCGTTVAGRYCQNCGQENLHPKESAWHLIVHFFNDVTHFDGKLFSTLKFLITKPGFLTAEYMRGRRAAYLNPIRMYLFISALFFLLLMSFFLPEANPIKITNKSAVADTIKQESSGRKISKGVKEILTSIDTTSAANDNELIVLKNNDTFKRVEIEDYLPETVGAFDSMQNLLPPDERATGLTRIFARKAIAINNYEKIDKNQARHKLITNFFHSMPYMLFFSLPIIALFLKLLYIRRKQYYYVSHGIFVIHYFCVLFIGLLLSFALSKAGAIGYYFSVAIKLSLFIYLLIAMRRFYKQGWLKTIFKFLMLYSVSLVYFLIVFIILIINSVLNLG